jgi:hypothetical protein
MLFLTDINPLKSISMFPSVLFDHIIDRSAPTCLLSDSAKVEMRRKSRISFILMGWGAGRVNHIINIRIPWNIIIRT